MNFAAVFRVIGVRGFIAIGLALALGVAMWRADAISGERDKLRTALAGEQARHAVTRQSLATLQRELDAMVKDGEMRAERLAQARREAIEATAGLREQAARIGAVAASPGDPCVTPDAVRGAKGL